VKAFVFMVVVWMLVPAFSGLLSAREGLTEKGGAGDTLTFRGQMSVWGAFNPSLALPLQTGGRIIPQANYAITTGKKQMVDAEGSLNIGGTAAISPFDSLTAKGKIKPYRAWLRFSGRQFETRIGLQKINFGSAAMLRPLMWFDQLDPRDPLQLTDGVWALLGRYYFLNNANLWMWGLVGNKGLKTWETGTTLRGSPEMGGRLQLPLFTGETALSYHFRKAELKVMGMVPPGYGDIPEHRFGVDGKWDAVIGIWAEAAWMHKARKAGLATNQHFLTLGADYTIPLGGGLNATFEHLMISAGEKPFGPGEQSSLSALMMGYPLGLSGRITAIVYRDWSSGNQFNFLSLQKQFKHIRLYVMAFLNPEEGALPQQGSDNPLFAGTGMQMMLVYDY